MTATKPTSGTDTENAKEQILHREIAQMLENGNPLTGIYSIYGDYPIDPNLFGQARMKKLERMNAVR
jgi:hypothetical protein